jgi:hypothetical protein
LRIASREQFENELSKTKPDLAIATTLETQPSASSQGEEKKAPDMAAITAPRWKKYVNAFLAGELSTLTRYYDRLIQWLPREDDKGMLLASIDAPAKQIIERDESFPDLTEESDQRTAILINGTFNHEFDIQGLLSQLKPKLSRTSRVIAILYNPYLRSLYSLANRLGIRKGELPSTFVTQVDLQNIVKVAGFEIARSRLAAIVPGSCWGLATSSIEFCRSCHWSVGLA